MASSACSSVMLTISNSPEAMNSLQEHTQKTTVIPPFCHSAILPFCHSAILPSCHSAILPFCHSAILHPALLPFRRFSHLKYWFRWVGGRCLCRRQKSCMKYTWTKSQPTQKSQPTRKKVNPGKKSTPQKKSTPTTVDTYQVLPPGVLWVSGHESRKKFSHKRSVKVKARDHLKATTGGNILR